MKFLKCKIVVVLVHEICDLLTVYSRFARNNIFSLFFFFNDRPTESLFGHCPLTGRYFELCNCNMYYLCIQFYNAVTAFF